MSEPSRDNPNGPIGTEVIFENDKVRVWDMRVGPRGNKAWHHHTMDYVIVNVTGGKVEIENVQGQIYVAEDKAGRVIWRDAGEKHELRNLTDEPYRNILIELKGGKLRPNLINGIAPTGSVPWPCMTTFSPMCRPISGLAASGASLPTAAAST